MHRLIIYFASSQLNVPHLVPCASMDSQSRRSVSSSPGLPFDVTFVSPILCPWCSFALLCKRQALLFRHLRVNALT